MRLVINFCLILEFSKYLFLFAYLSTFIFPFLAAIFLIALYYILTCGRWAVTEQQQLDLIQIKLDNGPENSGVRTQFLNRIVDFADEIQKSIQLLYFPPYHSKYNPIERCWGILEQHLLWSNFTQPRNNVVLGKNYEMERNQAYHQSQSGDLSKRNFFNEESHGRY